MIHYETQLKKKKIMSFFRSVEKQFYTTLFRFKTTSFAICDKILDFATDYKNVFILKLK